MEKGQAGPAGLTGWGVVRTGVHVLHAQWIDIISPAARDRGDGYPPGLLILVEGRRR